MDCCQPLENEMGGFHQSQNDWNTRGGGLVFWKQLRKIGAADGHNKKKNEPAASIERELEPLERC